jgi:hypothetical protein
LPAAFRRQLLLQQVFQGGWLDLEPVFFKALSDLPGGFLPVLDPLQVGAMEEERLFRVGLKDIDAGLVGATVERGEPDT